VRDVLLAKLSKRGVDVRFLDLSAKPRRWAATSQAGGAGEDRHRQRGGQEDPDLIKASKLKVQAAIQGDAVRVTGAKRDDLQAPSRCSSAKSAELPLSFTNFRD
jgi:cyclic-di-GMP-binding protein